MRADEHKRIDKIARELDGVSAGGEMGDSGKANEEGREHGGEKRLDRRTFIAKGLMAGGALVGGGLAISRFADANDGSATSQSPPPALAPAQQARRPTSSGSGRPNILVIMVDQLRSPQWIGPEPGEPGLPANLARLRRDAVYFERHYTAANDCTPSRAALLTGLYTHQTGCMITGGSTLDPAFPTWGSMLREHGYRTRWYGKWHLTHGDNKWTPERGEHALERYGFAGGTYPSPDGGPGQGWRVDPLIAGQFEQWYASVNESEPWCATVSFVDPHDIAWWYGWSERVPAEMYAPSVADQLPANFETPELLIERNKPRLQRSLQETAAASFGAVPFTGPEVTDAWLGMLDLYIKLQVEVDAQVGRVLDALESRPRVARDTVVVFTSDHGEYLGSHGLRGKGAGAYDEAIRVPLIVKDPRGVLTSDPETARTQLTSSVDVAPLLLRIATGSDEWRGERRYSHLAGRLDIAGILADPSAAGRPYVLHATDETVTEFASQPYAADAPLHVVALRTPEAKFATYSNWEGEEITPLSEGQERELYDYGTHSGRLELHNSAGESPLEESLQALMRQAFVQELRRPLPQRLLMAHARGFDNYFTIATRAALHAAEHRSEQEELTADSSLYRRRAPDHRAGGVERLNGHIPGRGAQRDTGLKPALGGPGDRIKRSGGTPG